MGHSKVFAPFVFLASCAAIVLALMKLLQVVGLGLSVFNILRSLVFAGLSFYLWTNPSKVDFFKSVSMSSGENQSEANLKLARMVSIIAAAFNLGISAALYFD